MNKTIFLWVVIFILHCGCTENDNGASTFLDNETGQWLVEHPTTGLYWRRCPVGQEWNDAAQRCEGEKALFYLVDAVNACPQGLTLPNDEDFATVLCNMKGIATENCPENEYDTCADCSICNSMFKGNTEGDYLSADIGIVEVQKSDDYWMTRIWGFGSGCVGKDGDHGSSYLRYNVHCVKKQNIDTDLLPDLDAGMDAG